MELFGGWGRREIPTDSVRGKTPHEVRPLPSFVPPPLPSTSGKSQEQEAPRRASVSLFDSTRLSVSRSSDAEPRCSNYSVVRSPAEDCTNDCPQELRLCGQSDHRETVRSSLSTQSCEHHSVDGRERPLNDPYDQPIRPRYRRPDDQSDVSNVTGRTPGRNQNTRADTLPVASSVEPLVLPYKSHGQSRGERSKRSRGSIYSTEISRESNKAPQQNDGTLCSRNGPGRLSEGARCDGTHQTPASDSRVDHDPRQDRGHDNPKVGQGPVQTIGLAPGPREPIPRRLRLPGRHPRRPARRAPARRAGAGVAQAARC